jgi:hypothetical protein
VEDWHELEVVGFGDRLLADDPVLEGVLRKRGWKGREGEGEGGNREKSDGEGGGGE